jgi:3',5'-cyclic AMP phosphodiesterase CpdA
MLVQFSDLHLRAGSEGAAQAARLGAAVRAAAALRPRADAVLLSGDLADEPSREAYELTARLLAPLGLPVHAIPGNHDDRDLLRACFGPPATSCATRVCFAVRCGALRVVACDSTIAGSERGEIGGEQLAWLDRTLGEQRDVATLVALHHPPVLTGIRAMDAIALDAVDSAGLEALLRDHPQVRALTCGHVHTTMISSFAGKPLVICPSTSSAVELDLRVRDDLPFATAAQPLGFAVHALIGDRLVTHVQPVERLA